MSGVLCCARSSLLTSNSCGSIPVKLPTVVLPASVLSISILGTSQNSALTQSSFSIKKAVLKKNGSGESLLQLFRERRSNFSISTSPVCRQEVYSTLRKTPPWEISRFALAHSGLRSVEQDLSCCHCSSLLTSSLCTPITQESTPIVFQPNLRVFTLPMFIPSQAVPPNQSREYLNLLFRTRCSRVFVNTTQNAKWYKLEIHSDPYGRRSLPKKRVDVCRKTALHQKRTLSDLAHYVRPEPSTEKRSASTAIRSE